MTRDHDQPRRKQQEHEPLRIAGEAQDQERTDKNRKNSNCTDGKKRNG